MPRTTMANGSRARSKEGAEVRESFTEAPTRLGLPFQDADGPSRSGSREVATSAEVVSLHQVRGATEATAQLTGAREGLGGGAAVAPSNPPGGRRRRRDRRTGDRNVLRHRPEDRVGQVLSATYRIERLIAVGGMGAVYEVAHMRLSQRFAVKFLDRGLSSDAEAYARFRQEAEIAAQVNHDNVVQVFDFNTDEAGSPYMVMELVAGETLDRFIARQAPFARDEVLAVFEPLCHALEACHQSGVVHRDLKPSNIMVFEHGDGRYDLKLLDFGICKIKQEGAGDMTRENVVMGTPNYMSPEQASGNNRQVDARADIFALGAILYEMLSGQKAFDADGLPQLLHAIVYDDPDPLADFGVPARVADVVQGALAKQVEQRTPSVTELLVALRSAYQTRVERLTATVPASTRRAGLGTGAWLFALLTSVGVACLATYLVAVPATPEGVPSEKIPPQTRELPTPEPKVAAGPERFDPELAASATSRLVTSSGRLYRADRSSLGYWADAHAEPRTVVLPSTAPVTAMQLSNDRRELWVGQGDGWVTRWDHALKEEPWRRDFGGKPITAIAAGSGYLAVGSGPAARLLSAKTEKVLRTFKGKVDIDALLVTPGKRPLLLIFRGETLEIVDADQRRSLSEVPLGGSVQRVGLADATVDGEAHVWTEREQGDWIVRRTYRIFSPTVKQPPRFENIKTERRD